MVATFIIDSMRKKVSVAYNLSRIYQYYGSIIFITALGASLIPELSFTHFLILLTANISMTIFFFSFNNVEDHKDDARDIKKSKHNPIAQGKVSPLVARIFSFSSLGMSLFFYSLLGLVNLYFGLIIGLICFLYSWRKVRLKAKPGVDLISHGLFHSFIFINSTLIGETSPNFVTTLLIAALMFYVSVLVDFESEIRDYKVDKAAKLNNTISKLNIQQSGNILVYLSIIPVVVFFGYLILNTNIISALTLSIIGAFVALHYLFVWNREVKFVYYYPYSQQTLLAYGFVIAFIK